MTTRGTVNLYSITTANPRLASIAAGADGNVWFSNPGLAFSLIGKISPAGIITQYPTPKQAIPGLMTLAGDNNLYATGGPPLLKISMTGTMTLITDSTNPNGFSNTLATGPDGNVWGSRLCVDPTKYCLDRYDVNRGGFVEPRFPSTVPDIAGLVTGSDGNLWFQQFSHTPVTDGLGAYNP